MRRNRYVRMCILLMALLMVLVGCNGSQALSVLRAEPSQAEATETSPEVEAEEAAEAAAGGLSISNVSVNVSDAAEGMALMNIQGTIANDTEEDVEQAELPVVKLDGEAHEITYELSGKKKPKLKAGKTGDFEAAVEFDPSEEHEWRIEAADGTNMLGLNASAKFVLALHDYRTAAFEAGESAPISFFEYDNPGYGYTLEEVVVLARHNVRAPLSTNGSAIERASAHPWIDWSAAGSELTLRGGILETMMGQYVRTWLEYEGLFPANYRPEDGAVRFYANAKQRTIATSQYFASGLLPVGGVQVETSALYDEMDPVFTPKFTFVSDAYIEAALAQIAERGGQDGMAGIAADLEDSYQLIEDVVGYEESPGFVTGKLGELDTTDTGVEIKLGEEPAMTGSLKLACQLSDALVLQYYEALDEREAGFGQELSFEQWQTISAAKDVYNDTLFTAPLVAVNVAHPLVREIRSELDMSGRKFSFLCGHDSNVASVLAALGVEDYELPGSIESSTPIGCMLVFEKWADGDGQEFVRVRLMYQSAEQIRELSMLQKGEVPQIAELSFTGLSKNADGLYALADLRGRMIETEGAYYQLMTAYDDELIAAAAAEAEAEAAAAAEAEETATEEEAAEGTAEGEGEGEAEAGEEAAQDGEAAGEGAAAEGEAAAGDAGAEATADEQLPDAA